MATKVTVERVALLERIRAFAQEAYDASDMVIRVTPTGRLQSDGWKLLGTLVLQHAKAVSADKSASKSSKTLAAQVQADYAEHKILCGTGCGDVFGQTQLAIQQALIAQAQDAMRALAASVTED